MENVSLENSQSGSLDVKLDYLQRDVREIKADVKDIKNDFVPRREFNDGLKEVKERYDPFVSVIKDYSTDKAKMWVAIAVLTVLGGTIITLSVMAINSKIQTGIRDALNEYDIEAINN